MKRNREKYLFLDKNLNKWHFKIGYYITKCSHLFNFGIEIFLLNSARVLKNRTNREQMFQKIGWLSVKQIIVYFSTMAVFTMWISGEPAELARIFRDESRTGRITFSQARIQLVQAGFVYRATNSWNTLPLDFRTIDSSSTFKMKLREWIIKHINVIWTLILNYKL